jgi:hypothetical protein
MDDHDDSDIIDLGAYRRRRPEARRSAFAVWGGEGERSRFALPVWRAVYLVGGERGGLVWVEDDDTGKTLNPFFVLDLASETPRTTFATELLGDLRGSEVAGPILSESFPGGAAVFLGVGENRRWFLVVHDGGLPRQPMDASSRNDLLFLAGECAGLLLHRRLDQHPAEAENAEVWAAEAGWDEEEPDEWSQVPPDGFDEEPVSWNGPGLEVSTGDAGAGGAGSGETGGEAGSRDGPEEDPDPPAGRGRGHLRSL